MFTGIIEEVGKIRSLVASTTAGQLCVAAERVLSGVKLGDSIAVNGVCLTVTKHSAKELSFDISAETLQRTTLGSLRSGDNVNLERALAVGERLGGHIVQGHVDGRGRFLQRLTVGASVMMRFAYPHDLARYICLKGSITVDGISLTVAQLDNESFEVAVVPHTLKSTNLEHLANGDKVNLGVDILAKYLERLLSFSPAKEQPAALTLERLRDMGY